MRRSCSPGCSGGRALHRRRWAWARSHASMNSTDFPRMLGLPRWKVAKSQIYLTDP
jgi:hypothetical protein